MTSPDFHLCCLLLDDQHPLPFSIRISPTDSLDALQIAVKDKKPLALAHLDSSDLRLHQSHIPITSNTPDLLHLTEQAKQNAAQSNPLANPVATVQSIWSQTPDPSTIHLLVAIPPRSTPIDLPAGYRPIAHQPSGKPLDRYVSFNAPEAGSFGSLTWALTHNRIVQSQTSHRPLPKRRLPDVHDPSTPRLQTLLKSQFSEHFTHHAPAPDVFPHEPHAYINALEDPMLPTDVLAHYESNPEEYTTYFLLRSLYSIGKALGDKASYAFRRSWRFPLVVRVDGLLKYKYQPKSDLSFCLQGIPIILLEVCSDKVLESDRVRLLVQAACLVRLWNHLRGGSRTEVMAVYVTKDFSASVYLLFASEPDCPTELQEVQYLRKEYNLTDRLSAFHFLFRLFHFASGMSAASDEGGLSQDGSDLVGQISSGLLAFTTSKRKRDADPDARRDRKRPQQEAGQSLDSPGVRDALAAYGYQMEAHRELEDWTLLHPVRVFAPIPQSLIPSPNQLSSRVRRASGKHGPVVLKLLDSDPIELEVLEKLNGLTAGPRHVVELMETLKLDIGSVMVLSVGLPLDSCDLSSGGMASEWMQQLLDAVRFIHANGVAHLDLKPANAVVSQKGRAARLVLIDFGASVWAPSPDTEFLGFVGTRSWTAPEMGTEDGPPQRYSAVRADLWSCGRMLQHMAQRSGGVDPCLVDLAQELTHQDPLQRPLLHDEVGQRNEKGEQKRARLQGCDNRIQKRVRASGREEPHGTRTCMVKTRLVTVA